jgi:hypothetical protein
MDKSNPPTMFNVGTASSVIDWHDYCLDLNGTPIADELNTDAYMFYDDAGKLVSIGYCFECYGIVVNPDHVVAAGHSMDELVNFDGLKAVAEDIHARAEELGFDAFSLQILSDLLDGKTVLVIGTLKKQLGKRQQLELLFFIFGHGLVSPFGVGYRYCITALL